MSHLEEEEIAQHAAGLLPIGERSAAQAHLASCPVSPRGGSGRSSSDAENHKRDLHHPMTFRDGWGTQWDPGILERTRTPSPHSNART